MVLLPGVTSANSRSQRAEHQRGTGDSQARPRRPGSAYSRSFVPDRAVPAPAPQGGTRMSPGFRAGQAGPSLGTRHSHPSSPRPSSPAPPSQISHAGLRSGICSDTCGRAEPRRQRNGPTASTGLHGDSLLPPLAWPSRSFPKLCCEQKFTWLRSHSSPTNGCGDYPSLNVKGRPVATSSQCQNALF